MMYFGMAALAQAHQVFLCMRSAPGYGNDMMDLFHQGYPTFSKTHFTERVLCCIPIPYPFPGPSVFSVDVR